MATVYRHSFLDAPAKPNSPIILIVRPIVAKVIEKEPARRYQSTDELAAVVRAVPSAYNRCEWARLRVCCPPQQDPTQMSQSESDSRQEPTAALSVPAGSAESSARTSRPWMWPLLIVAATGIVFQPTLENGFVWDDYPNIVNNDRYQGLGPEQLRWMFTTFHLGHYQPLSWLSLSLDFTLQGNRPAGYHLTNLALHIANGLLVYAVGLAVFRTRGRRAPGELAWIRPAAGLAALGFALHPLRVESTAWVTERRDVLSAAFILLTVWLYLRAHRDAPRVGRLGLVLVCYLLSLLSKAGGMTLPLILLVLDWYPLRRFGGGIHPRGETVGRILAEKTPFAVLAVFFAVLAALAQGDTASLLSDHPIPGRFAQACYGLVFYAWKTAVPTHLIALYDLHPRLPINPLQLRYALPILLVCLLTAGCWKASRRRPALPAAALCYALLLAPVLGFWQSGPQEVADRYSYLACIPCMYILAATVTRWGWRAGSMRRAATLTASLIVMTVWGGLTWAQCHVWRNSLTLWSHAARFADRSRTVHQNLGFAREQEGLVDPAIEALREARRIEPVFLDLNLPRLLLNQHRFKEATEDLTGVLAHHPSSVEAHVMNGSSLAGLNQPESAIVQYREALRLDPLNLPARIGLIEQLLSVGNDEAAAEEYSRASMLETTGAEEVRALKQIAAEHPAVASNDRRERTGADRIADIRANAERLAATGQWVEAAAEYRRTLDLAPNDFQLHYALGLAHAAAGELDKALESYRRTLVLRPETAEAHLAIGLVFVQKNMPEEAIRAYREAIRINPRFHEAHYNLGTALAHLQRFDEAITSLEEALAVAKGPERGRLEARIRARIAEYRERRKR